MKTEKILTLLTLAALAVVLCGADSCSSAGGR